MATKEKVTYFENPGAITGSTLILLIFLVPLDLGGKRYKTVWWGYVPPHNPCPALVANERTNLAHSIISQFHVTVRIDQNVVQFQIAIDDPPRVKEVKRQNDLRRIKSEQTNHYFREKQFLRHQRTVRVQLSWRYANSI